MNYSACIIVGRGVHGAVNIDVRKSDSGDRDTNDSLTFRDGYDEQDEKLIFDNFGSNLAGRLRIAERAYQKAGCVRCRFVVYKGIGHETNPQVWTDVKAFFTSELNRRRRATEQIIGREGETATFIWRCPLRI